MSTELRIPEGIVVRTARGGPDILKGILGSLKQYAFTGYVKVILKKENLSSTGYIVMEQGEPTLSIYQFEKKEPKDMKRIYAGDKSLSFIWEDAQDKQSLIELHSRVQREEFERRFPDAKLQDLDDFRAKIARPQITRKVASKKQEEEEADEAEEEEEEPVLQEIRKMRQDGYIVDNLERLYKSNKGAAEKELPKYREGVEELVEIGRLLDAIPRTGLEDEIDALKQKLNDPSKLESVRGEMAKLKERIKKRIEQSKAAEIKIEQDLRKKKQEEKSGDLYNLIMEYKEKVPEARGEAKETETEPAAEERKIEAAHDELTFDSFVVGSGNKFAFAAAAAVASAPDKAYNPLYLYGKSGLGKTHLLSAIARKIAADYPGGAVMISAEKFTEDLERAVKGDKLHDFRDGLRKKKALLIDDFQFLLGKEAAQGELLYLLDEMKKGGGQIVIASDRLPKEIPRLLESLSAKIQGGLIADLQPPDEQTSIEILKRKAKDKGKPVPEEALRYVAEKFPSSVREMEAALNRLIAFSSVMKVEIDLRLANEILAPTLVGVQEEKRAEEPGADIKPGHSYLIEEDRPAGSIKLYAKKVDEGFKGLEISRLNPKQIREDLGAKGELLWLTDKDSKTEATIAPSLEVIIHKVEETLPQGEKGVLLIDGLQYLISNTSFESVLRFIRRLIDDFSEGGSIMMISVSAGTLKTQELSILERELETIKLE